MTVPIFRHRTETKFFYGHVVIAAGFLTWLIGFGTNATFSVFLTPVTMEFGWTRAEISIGYSLALFVQACLGIIMGWLTDKIGPRLVISVFGSFLGLCYLLLSQINALWQFQLIFGLFAATGISALVAPVMATVARWFAKKRGLMIGIVQAGLSVGGFIFPPFIGWLILTQGWRFAYVIMGIITVAGMILAGLLLKRDPNKQQQLPTAIRVENHLKFKRQDEKLPSSGLSLRESIYTRQFWLIAALYCCFGFCRSSFLVHIVAYIQDLGYSLADGSKVLSVLFGSSLFGRIAIGRLGDKIGSRPSLVVGFLVTAITLIWGLINQDLWGLYIFGIFFGFGWGGQAVLRFSVTSESFGELSMGLIMAVLGLGDSAGAAFGSFFAGYIFDTYGNYQPVFWIGIAVSIAAVILSLLLKTIPKE